MTTLATTMTQCIRLSVCTVAGLAVSTATADMPITITLAVDDGPMIFIEKDYTEKNNGVFHYIGEYLDPNGQWRASWNYSIDPDAGDDASMLGSARVVSTSNQSHDFMFRIEVPLCPQIEQESIAGAFVVVAIQTNHAGGTMSNVGSNAIWSMLADGQVAKELFHPPFLLGSTGSGSASLTNQFGVPMPSYHSVPFEQTVGLQHVFRLTSGDIATFDTTLVVGALDDLDLRSCEHLLGDLNNDGVVNVQDLLILVQQWGRCNACTADLNDDGVVNIADLMLLMANWS
jgi:hypothetical protein